MSAKTKAAKAKAEHRAAAKRAAEKRARRPIYGTWEKVIIPGTGEERLAFLASHPIDRALLKERGWRRGAECRAVFAESRNVKFHRLAHAVGRLLVENVEEFRDVDSHEALKRVQRASGVACDVVEVDASPIVAALLAACEAVLGQAASKMLAAVLPQIRTIPMVVARSLAFDRMEESDFVAFFNGITAYIAEHYTSVMLDDVLHEFWRMIDGNK